LKKYSVIFATLLVFFLCSGQRIFGQEVEIGDTLPVRDTLSSDHVEIQAIDTAATILLPNNILFADSLIAPVPVPSFMPDPAKATWYALICPGLGQIYNRSYWKVPVLYGGIATLSYLIMWNGRMYNDYRNAFHDIMDNDPLTRSYEPIFYNMPNADLGWKQNTLKRKRDFYRRNRDLSMFGMMALYVASVIDAFVDAQLYNFSVSEDLSLRVEPVINNFFDLQGDPNSNMLGFKCTINF
jgi:hypothetical protein